MRTTLDPVLVEAARQGDPAALETLLATYQPTVTRFAKKYCATPEDVEDAVQETLWVAAQKIGTLRVSAAFLSFVFRIVRHQCYALLHAGEAQRAALMYIRIPEHDLLLRRDVMTALADLPPNLREVLIMRDVEDLTAPQVAEALQLTIATVKSRLHRARALMRESLKAWVE